jgi:NodT family efflux transporter outer membrane factor (OMF) lipoprotein
MRRLGGLGAGVLLSACAVGPNYHRPAAANPDRYTHDAAPVAAGSVAAPHYVNGQDIPAQWWALYHSPTLDALVRSALSGSPTLQAARATLRQAQENVYAQESSFLPFIDGNAQAKRAKLNGAEIGIPSSPGFLYTLYNASVSVSYTFDIWGENRRMVESAQAQAENAHFQEEGAYLTLTSNVVTAFVTLASLQEQIDATQRIVDDDRKNLEIVQRQFDLGGASKVDVLTQESQLAQEVATLPALRKQQALAEDQLAVYLGRTPSELQPVKATLADIQLPQEVPLSLPSKLVEQRPDVRAQEALVHSASAQVGVAIANMLPQLTLSANYGQAALTSDYIFKSASNIWSLAGSLDAPIFHGGQLLHRRRAADAALEQAAAQYRQTVLVAFQNVADALRAASADADALAAQTQANDVAAHSLAIASAQYKAGGVSFLTLLTAERAYHQANIALVQARAARLSDSAALFQALGGGWWNRSPGDEGNTPAAAASAS